MAETIKCLGQAEAPAAGVWQTLYTVPASKTAVVSLLNVCETGGTNHAFSVVNRVGGAAIVNKHFQSAGVAIGVFEVVEMLRGMTLAAGDIIQVKADTPGVAFSLYGVEADV